MKISVRDENHGDYDVIDLDTGCRIPFVQEADDETGYFTILLPDSDKYPTHDFIKRFNEDGKLEIVEFRFKGNIKIVRK